MTARVRATCVGIVLTTLLALLIVMGRTSSAASYAGSAQASVGSIALTVTIDPPVGQPGDVLQLTVSTVNSGAETLLPSVAVTLPPGLSPANLTLPAGATFNVQEHRLEWLPAVPPGGSSLRFTIPLLVSTVDVVDPESAVQVSLRHQGAADEASATIWTGILPIVREVSHQISVAVGQPLELQADVVGPGPITYGWLTGDGRRMDVAEPVVVYPAAGEYEVELIASNPAGSVTQRTKLNVLPQPIAGFEPDDANPGVGQAVTFRSMSGGQPPLSVVWDFGDGNTISGVMEPTHQYAAGGTYVVHLVIENSLGRSDAFWQLEVGHAPTVEMVASAQTAVGQALTFQAQGDPSITRYTWEMGDGRSHEGSAITHQYRLPGDYYVLLTAINDFGASQTGNWIHVEPGITSLFMPILSNVSDEMPAGFSAEAPDQVNVVPAVQSLDGTFEIDALPIPTGASPAEQLFAYINAARAQFDLPPLDYSFELSAAAQQHTLDKSLAPDRPHTGSDGSTAAERLLRAGYRGGYAGEATAWGFADPREAVEFWMNSNNHRPLLLNTVATEVGVAYVEDHSSRNVWHWTAEFGTRYGSPIQAQLRVLSPESGITVAADQVANYGWFWPLPLASDQRFVVYVVDGSRTVSLGSMTSAVTGSYYLLSTTAETLTGAQVRGVLNSEWFVRLEDGRGQVVAESERRPIALDLTVLLPPPVQTTMTPAIPTPTATSTQPAATPTPTTISPGEDPGSNPLPVIITATPVPSP